MTLVFNLLPVVITGVFLYWGYSRWKKVKKAESILLPLILGTASLLLYFQVQPSYLPKGEIKRTVIQQFEQKDLQVKDVVPKPMDGAERDRKREEKFKEPLPFLDKDN